MKQSFIFVDIQGFKDYKNYFIIKELALVTAELTQVFLIKPPYSFSYLNTEEKKHVLWIERNRGIFWREGYIDYREFKRMIVPLLSNKNIIVKGQEKLKWLSDLCLSECFILDVGEKGCPNLLTLFETNVKDKYIVNCFYHKKCCALKNALCIKKWYYDNHMYLFNLTDM